MFGYSLIRAGQNQPLFQSAHGRDARFGIPDRGAAHGNRSGVYEARFCIPTRSKQPTARTLFKTGAKEIGNRFRYHAELHGEVERAVSGCSGHVHQAFRTAKNNVFTMPGRAQMSQIVRKLSGRQLHCPERYSGLLRTDHQQLQALVDGFWAPVTATWVSTIVLRACV
jgi:glutamine synthetase